MNRVIAKTTLVLFAALLLVGGNTLMAHAAKITVNSRSHLKLTYIVNYRVPSGPTANTIDTVNSAEFYTTKKFNGKNYIGYCIDPLQNAQQSNNVINPDSWNGPDGYYAKHYGNWKEAAWIIENQSPGLDWTTGKAVNPNSMDYRIRVQAVQLAIWEVIADPKKRYSDSAFARGNGAFEVYQANKKSLALAYSILRSLNKAKESGKFKLSGKTKFLIADDPKKQDLLLASKGNSGSETPEPGTMLLLGSAAGLAAYRRRKNAKKD